MKKILNKIKSIAMLVGVMVLVSGALSLLWNGFAPNVLGCGRVNIIQTFWFVCFMLILKMLPGMNLRKEDRRGK